MKISIERSFDVSDFKIEEVNRSSKWKSIKSRTNYVAGEVFYSVYLSQSFQFMETGKMYCEQQEKW
jgi:hypothetical protein